MTFYFRDPSLSSGSTKQFAAVMTMMTQMEYMFNYMKRYFSPCSSANSEYVQIVLCYSSVELHLHKFVSCVAPPPPLPVFPSTNSPILRPYIPPNKPNIHQLTNPRTQPPTQATKPPTNSPIHVFLHTHLLACPMRAREHALLLSIMLSSFAAYNNEHKFLVIFITLHSFILTICLVFHCFFSY